MQLFYSSDISENTLLLTEDDHRHCTKVLRKKVGDKITVTDGKGNKFSCTITEISRNHTELLIVEKERVLISRPSISIAIAPTKNMSRFEWFLEKSTEIGIDTIYPILTKCSERKVLKTERCKKVILSAMKQSQQFTLPRIHELISWKEFIKIDHPSPKYIAYVDRENNPLASQCNGLKDVLLLIGPEGDFSKEEIDQAFANGFKAVSLGRNRLRTETAGIVGVQIINGVIDGSR